MFSKKTDYEGWTNWETWNTWLMLTNESPELYQTLHEVVKNGGGPQEIHDLALQTVIAKHNAVSLEGAQEWNSIPEDERVDHQYQDLLNRLGVDSIEELPENARKFHDLLGLGPDVEDIQPNLIDPDLVNWQEIHKHAAQDIWEDEAYGTDDQFNDEANPYLQDFVPDSPDDIKFSKLAKSRTIFRNRVKFGAVVEGIQEVKYEPQYDRSFGKGSPMVNGTPVIYDINSGIIFVGQPQSHHFEIYNNTNLNPVDAKTNHLQLIVVPNMPPPYFNDLTVKNIGINEIALQEILDKAQAAVDNQRAQMMQPIGYEPEVGQSIHSSLVNADQIYDTWTGLRLPWAKVSAVEGAGDYLRGVLKQPGKKLMTDEGQQFLQYLANLGEDIDPLTPWLTAQYKKGNLGFSKIDLDNLIEGTVDLNHPDEVEGTVLERVKEREEDGEIWERWRDPESGTTFSDEEAEHMPFALVDKGSNPPSIFYSSDLDKMAQWYNAKDHPTRQGANIQEMDLWDVIGAVKRHQKALKEEEETARAIEQTKDAGEIVHRFDNGYTIRKLNPEDLWAEGKLLGHCIGGQSYQDSLENGYIEVYSLRDPEGMPKVSWHYNQDGEVEEMQGRSGEPKQEYMEMIREWGEENNMPTELNQGEMYYHLGSVDDWGTFFELYSQHAEMGAWGMAAEFHEVNLNEEAEIDWGPVNIPAIVSDLFSTKGEGNIVEPIIQSGYFGAFVEEINKQIAEGDIDPNNPMQADYIKRIETASYQLRDPETGQIDSSSVWNYNEEEGTMHNPFEKHPEDPDYRLTPREQYDRKNPTNALFDYQPEFFTRLVDVSEEPKDGFTPPHDTVPDVAIQVGKGERAIPWWGEDSTLDDQELSWSQPSPIPYGYRQWPNETVNEYTDKAFSQEQWLGPASPYFQRYPQEIQNKFLR